MTSPDTKPSSMLRSAGLVGFMTLLSRITGLFQSRLVAHYLGVGLGADAFFVAYRIPNLLRRFTAEGTMTAAFLPTVSEVEASEGEEAARDMVAQFLGTLALCMLLLCILGIGAMGLITGLTMLGRLAPHTPWHHQLGVLIQVLAGRAAAPEDWTLTTLLGRIMFPYLGLVSLTAGLSAVLNLKGRFGLPASVSTFWNLAFLAVGYGSLHLGPTSWRKPVPTTVVFAIAVLIGGLVQLFVLWPSFRGLGYRLRWGFHFGHSGVRKALRRMVPGLLGTGIHPINVLISTILASQLPVGAQAVLFNSNMMGEMVLGLFAASIATVSLPTMSRLVDAGDLNGLRSSLASALRGTAVLAIPSSFGLAALAQPIIAVIFQTGRFDRTAVQWTATTLMFQAVGLLFIATGRIMAQCLYALKDYRTPAYAALWGVAANILFSLILMQPLGTSGIALANGLASLLGLGLLTRRLHQKLGHLPYGRVLGGWGSMGLASTGMAAVALLGSWMLALSHFRGTVGTSLRLFPLIAGASAVYFGLLILFRVPEAHDLLALVRRKLRI